MDNLADTDVPHPSLVALGSVNTPGNCKSLINHLEPLAEK